MRRIPRRVRKIIKSRRYGFRNARIFRRTGRGSVTRNIFRSSLRRYVKPEIKYIDTVWNVNLNTNIHHTQAISPSVIEQGTGMEQRIGNQLRFRWVTFRATVVGDSNIDITNEPVTTNVRMIFWTPRIDFTKAQDYMEDLPFLQTPDFNVVTVMKDVVMTVANYTRFADTTAVNQYQIGDGSAPYRRNLWFSFKFPRKVRFSPADDDIAEVNPDKDILYVTIINQQGAGRNVFVTVNSRTTFTDA